MKNLVKSFDQFVTEGLHNLIQEEGSSMCCGSSIDEMGMCTECGEYAGKEMEDDSFMGREDSIEFPADDSYANSDDWSGSDVTYEAKKKEKTRKEVLKDAEEKYPNLKAGSMKKGLAKMKGDTFKEKAKKNFGWADEPEAAAAAYMRKATKKEPRDL